MSEIFLHISAGSGPRECRWVVSRVTTELLSEARASGVNASLFDGVDEPGSEAASLFVRLIGKDAETFAVGWLGTIRWIGQSPFRPTHKRKNWYIGVSRAPVVEAAAELMARDVRFQTMRASGPGGQHVNTTDSAVRATHVPSGLSAVAMEERSQHANRKLALAKLAAMLGTQAEDRKAAKQETLWRSNHQLERGNEVRTYRGPRFKKA